MASFAYSICFGQTLTKLLIDVARRCESEDVHVIARRDAINPPKTRMVDPARQNQMAVKPGMSGSYDGERHAHLKGDPRFFRQYCDGPNLTNGRDKLVVEPPDRIRLATEVGRDSMPAARV